MSQVIGTKTYIIVTALGNVAMRHQLVTDYSVEDIVRDKALSQARLVHMINIGNNLDSNAVLPVESLPTIFQGSEELNA
jgi:hypothetical protein